jgi:hypothetical protein
MRLLLSCLFLFIWGSAQANELANPGFDTNISGWDIFQNRVAAWTDEDANGDTSSGSALLSNLSVSNGTVPLVLHQCIVVESGVEYEFGGDLLVLPDQPDDTAAYIFVQAFLSGDCSGGTAQIAQVSSTTVDDWVGVSSSITLGPGVTSLRVGLGVFKPTGVSAEARALFDNISLIANDGSVVNPSMSASWYNPAESGHGIMIHLLDAETAWMCWFTFDLEGNPRWICAVGVIQGDTIAFEDAFQVEGGAFPPNFDAEQIVEVPWGSIVVEFTGCDTGQMTWTTNAVGFESGEMPLARLTSLWGANCN